MGSFRANSGAAEDRGGKLAQTIEPDSRWDMAKLTLPTLHHAVPVPRDGVLPKHVGPAELDGAITNAARIRREHERNVRQARETEKGSGEGGEVAYPMPSGDGLQSHVHMLFRPSFESGALFGKFGSVILGVPFPSMTGKPLPIPLRGLIPTNILATSA